MMANSMEVERKFLLKDDTWKQASVNPVSIEQHYLVSEKGNTVRVRKKGDTYLLTIKEKIDGKEGMLEQEDEISETTFKNLKKLASSSISKTRYHYKASDGMVWEIDVFEGNNKGLVMAEVEMESLNQDIVIPDFIGIEVTNDLSYSNAELSKN